MYIFAFSRKRYVKFANRESRTRTIPHFRPCFSAAIESHSWVLIFRFASYGIVAGVGGKCKSVEDYAEQTFANNARNVRVAE